VGAAIWWNWRHVTSVANLNEEWWSYKNFGGRYATYETSDKREVLICPLEKNFWESFCDLLGLPADWRSRGTWDQSGMDHGTKYPWERAEIAKAIVQKPFDYWIREFTRINIPFAPIYSLQDTIGSEHIAANHMLRKVSVRGHDATIPALPIETNQQEPVLRTPELGEHNAEFLREIGLGDLSGQSMNAQR
jgi:crotonobetainyl-CoA:carnitine CoA-transferase CaiB-like acyl-CoA transferase